ncbi:hypothetical protein EMIHUDRAFT_226518 [Emiliania huxleyi CCMP1516]|uniref:C3H1-type domain-containing protein n=4 Tax=Emiliania huxleyi TaxID=2903 RepID=A0A0D3IPW6_EMIH1|nr:hypothetical protein EMIHUDRAFT_246999 [Emiliania huxleyi CCMP1516]XP_005788667.1 hypothetical protein EMIHUDRAFT_226518 [Emiliania huxleyi CCMP1516]EOD13301.1 hypothetical protein EMIHUDRAFT_246999 [Emiliania huxleyi CCMP1516]EOD36238.1 hypothetical protein EMIHUDRAFT_226518 [Emiliania huxleyi CCMP1516]|eukprot:XP_005765730.1 hypothetical protein EMIHUDRAFT_246999 [Emiliania huxleyi CCMP1516]
MAQAGNDDPPTIAEKLVALSKAQEKGNEIALMGSDGARPEYAILAERAAELTTEDQPKTAARQLSALEDEGGELTNAWLEDVLTQLRDIEEPEGGWKVTSDGVDWTGSWAKGQLRQLIKQLRNLAEAEEKARALLVSSSTTLPQTPTEVSGGRAPAAPMPAPSRTKEEKDLEKFASARVWWQAQRAAPRDAYHLPSKDMVVAFSPYDNGEAPPPLPQLSKVVAAGRQQEVAKGRESPLGDLISALLALAIAYAGPLPANATLADCDEATLDVMDTSTGETEKRAPALNSSIADLAVDRVVAALGPLAPSQQEEYARSIWNELIAQHSARRGSLTAALVATMASAELIAARKDKRKAPAPPKKDVAQAAKEPTASKGGKKPRQPSWEGLPICPAWKKDGACHAYRQRRCNEYRHPPEMKKKTAERSEAPAANEE